MKKAKRLISVLLSVVMLFSITAGVDLSAYADTSGDYKYTVLEDGTAEITGYLGSGGNITIPSEIDGYTITSIGSYAFFECIELKSVIIPDTVTDIKERAFDSCFYLNYASIGNNVINIGNAAFFNCRELTNLTIPESVTNIGNSAFVRCSSLTSIIVDENNTVYDSRNNCNAIINTETNTLIKGCINTVIPDNVLSIGNYAFSDCTKLTNLTIPNSVTSIGNDAFSDCTNLTSILIPDSVTNIGSSAFTNCKSLTAIIIPDNITNILEDTFRNCSRMKSITIGSRIENIDNSAFWGCSSLTSIIVDENNTAYDSRNNCNAIIETETNTLIQGCKNTIISYGVTSIGNYAFFKCTNLTSISIPDSVTSIGDYAFSYCTNLTNISIPGSVTSIGNRAFDSCRSLKSISIPDSVTCIKNSTFCDCINLTNVSIGKRVTSIEYCAFYNCADLINITIPDCVTSIDNRAFDSCRSLKSITIPDSVTSIGDYAFSNCTNLTSISIPDSVTCIKDSTFCDCINLTNVSIGKRVTSIGNKAFDSCRSLKSITIPDSVTSIGGYAFYGCTNLLELVIPAGINLGANAFINCTNIEKITISAGTGIIQDFPYPTYLYTPWYISRDNLKSVTIENGINNIGSNAFYGCSGLTSITIPDSVINIGDKAFYGCTNLTSAIIGNNVEIIGNDAFSGCSSLTSITIPNSVLTINTNAFENCSNLSQVQYLGNKKQWRSIYISNGNDDLLRNKITFSEETTPTFNYIKLNDGTLEITTVEDYDQNVSIPSTIDGFSVSSIAPQLFSNNKEITHVYIPDSVINIGSSAFYGCSNLINITIPDSVINIGDEAFYGCTNLTSAIIGNNVEIIGNDAFSGCSSLTSITIPDSVTSIINGSFNGCTSMENIFVSENNNVYDSRNNCNAIIETATNTLIQGCKNTIIQSDVTGIGEYAFYNCSNLVNIIIPSNVKNIGNSAFYGCSNLTDVYYTGTEEQWNDIVIDDWNESLQNATIHFNYVPECSHVYKVISVIPATVDTNEVIMYQCSLCGNQYVEESSLNLADFKIKTVSLSLTSSITMNFKVLKTAVADFENPYVQFTRNGNTVTVSEYTEQGDYLVFSYNDIAPQAMNDTVTAILKATHNTIEYSSSPLEYSVSKYAYTMLDKCSGDQYAKLRTLIVDLLNYGAEAQSYQNYKTDDLVNSKLTDTQKAWASTDELALADVTDKNYATVENALVEWKSASLQLNNSVAVRYKFTAKSVDNLSVKVNCGASQWEYSADSFTDNGDGTYYFLFNDLNADKMSEDIFITVMNGDTAVSNTMRFSVESYSKKVQDLMPNSSLQKLTDAMMRYGKSAANYA